MTEHQHQDALTPDVIRMALEDAPDAMLIVDGGGIVRYANNAVTALFGRLNTELVGHSIETLVPERFREGHVAYRTRFTSDAKSRPMGGHRLDLCGLRADGGEFPVAISLRPVRCESDWLTVAAIRDISDHVAAERAIQEARDQAERANLAKSRFLATASHDLRQPLQTLGLLHGVLVRASLENAAAAEALAQQEHAIQSMSRLLNGLLDISKLESGAVTPKPDDFVVDQLFKELRDEFSSLAESKGLTLKVTPCEGLVHSDPSLVGQILRNLVSNAIKYTRHGWVALRCMHDTPSFVRIDVLDTGVGIPADQLRYVCDEFYRVDGPDNGVHEGYGLGLSIVQRLVTLLGLKFDIQSEVGRGSMFSVTLPSGKAVRSPAQGIATKPPVPGAAAHASVLLVEDDAGVRNATRLLLRSANYDVIAVSSMREALEQVRRAPPIDVVLTDYHLGGRETGIQVIAALRASLQRPLKAVLVTGDTSSAIRMLPSDPITQIASKPINAEDLLRLLRGMLAGS